ncbi:MAG TPA: serine/threonine-protein kinase, partial [Kofleriaceae bacterium]|nr:serine/threonine-protein kinase [Kofleriaceae bacterium]
MTRYELLERIGAGRMAEIFRARAIAAGGFEKPVAIKRILPHLSKDARFVELLIAEAKILSVLRHRNVVQIFDVGLGDDGTYFLVMEYVDGIDLGVLQRGLERRRARLPIDLVLHIGAEICDALDHAQQSPTPDGRPLGLVHRDVSPSNVLISRAGEVKLTDFGLARRPEDRRTAGGLRGRFAYVSPEQVAGLPVDGRSDVFSLGVVVWELAAGKRLFSAMADYEALRAITDLPIPPPSTQDRAVPAELDAILGEALSRDVERRLPSAGELGKRLRGLRYSLESSSGDPSAALARLIAGIEREPMALASLAGGDALAMAPPFDSAERSVVKIRTAEVFAQPDSDGTGLLEARRLLEAFEDAETRMSSLPVSFDDASTGGHQLRVLDERTELTAAPMHLGGDTGELRTAGEAARDTSEGRAVTEPARDTGEVARDGELPARDTVQVASDELQVRDTGETPALEPPTIPAAGAVKGSPI